MYRWDMGHREVGRCRTVHSTVGHIRPGPIHRGSLGRGRRGPSAHKGRMGGQSVSELGEGRRLELEGIHLQ